VLILVVGIWYLVSVRPNVPSKFANSYITVFGDALRVFYSTATILITVLGTLILFRRFYDSIYLWVFSAFSFALGGIGIFSVGFGAASVGTWRDARGEMPPEVEDKPEAVGIVLVVFQVLLVIANVRQKLIYSYFHISTWFSGLLFCVLADVLHFSDRDNNFLVSIATPRG
jgi:hypothetical protein